MTVSVVAPVIAQIAVWDLALVSTGVRTLGAMNICLSECMYMRVLKLARHFHPEEGTLSGPGKVRKGKIRQDDAALCG